MLTRLNLAYITMLGFAFSPWLGRPCMGAFEDGFTTRPGRDGICQMKR